MKVLELFAGTECMSNAFRVRGHECFTIDWNTEFPSSWHTDISKLTTGDIIQTFGIPDVIWIGTDCTTYSKLALSKHRTWNYEPISDYAKKCDAMNIRIKEIVNDLKKFNPNLIYFWENPVGALRWMPWMRDIPRYTITYCSYGSLVRKETDIWTNHPDPNFLPPCKPSANCHQKSSGHTGVIGMKSKIERGMYPKLLCRHIVSICEKEIENE